MLCLMNHDYEKKNQLPLFSNEEHNLRQSEYTHAKCLAFIASITYTWEGVISLCHILINSNFSNKHLNSAS